MPRCDLPDHRGINPLLLVHEMRIQVDDIRVVRGPPEPVPPLLP